MLLHLDFSPRPEEIGKVRDIWVFAFKNAIGRIDEELDTPRIQAAFNSCIHKLKKWPSPAEIIEHIPRRPEQKRIPFEHSQVDLGEKMSNVLNRIIAKEITPAEGAEIMRGEIDEV